jgi:regulatory protein YycH of two-component signal transduction system YycFG
MWYQGKMQLSAFLDAFSFDPADKMLETYMFSHFYLDFEGKRLIFANDDDTEAVEVRVKNKMDKLSTLLTNDKNTRIPVIDEDEYYAIAQPLKLKKYSYILATQPYVTYCDALFEEPDKVETDVSTNEQIFEGTNNEVLTGNSETNHIDFRGFIDRKKNPAEENIYHQSYQYISRLTSFVHNLRFFDIKNNEVTYRTYVEGFPVFSKEEKGKVKISVDKLSNKTDEIHLATNLDTIQVPIPTEEVVELEDTNTMLANVKNAGGDPKKITGIVIGYEWSPISTVKQVVDLTPSWYVDYNGKWTREAELIEQLGGGQ